MRLPQDIAGLLAVAIRDVIWFKQNVFAFLEECRVPTAIMIEIRRQRETPTIKLVHFVLDRLADKGEEGFKVALTMLTKMHYWNDVRSIPADRRDEAVASLKALQDGYQRYEAQVRHQKEREREMHAERLERKRTNELDHLKLQAFRDEFDRIHSLADPRERGNRFQDLMNRIFDYYCEESRGDFRRTGEQIDGFFYFDNHWHYVEIRWREEKASAADISVLRDRAKSGFGGDTKALFISFNGFSKECLDSLANQSDERVTLMDGFDLRCVLNCQIAFDVLLAEKQAELVMRKRPFIGAMEIIERRAGP